MKRFHLIFGWLMFVVFLLTGQYMDRFHNHLAEMSDGPRMLYRTRHIFILLAAMLHLGIGSYFSYRQRPLQKGLQLFGSVLITVSTILLVVGFFVEPNLAELETPYSHWAMYLIAFGTLLHFLSGIYRRDAREIEKSFMKIIRSAIITAVLLLSIQVTLNAQTSSGEFNTFWRAFKGAIARNDKQAVADMTKLPFMLNGKDEDRAGFLKQFNSLFPRSVKRCIATAKVLKEGDSFEIFCGEQIFLFGKDADGKFKFVEIGVND